MSADAAPTAFFNKTYDETLGLLVEMRDYVAHVQPRERAALAPGTDARFACEALRVTARLTQIMAWLLAQKAVHAGEMSTDEVTARHSPLAEIEICMAHAVDAELGRLPDRFLDLLDRSRRLYVRVARLDGMVRGRLH